MMDKLTASVQDIMKSRRESRPGPSFERFLFNLSKLHEKGLQFRYRLYKKRILKSRTLPCFVISIGNITAGGTGKTPMTIYLSQYLAELGYRVAIVTRGYKGKLEHKGGIVSDGRTIFHGPQVAGDEPYMMAQMVKCPVIAGKDRFKSGMIAIEKFSADIIVLDDAFQHLSLKRDLNIVLLDSEKPLGNTYLLPRGSLRETAASLHRSDAIIRTRSDGKTSPKEDLTNIFQKDIPIFKSSHVPYVCRFSTKKENDHFIESQSKILNQIKGKRAFLFSGIANNPAFKSSCEKIGLMVLGHIEFPDHHRYVRHDIEGITKAFKEKKADYIVTTLKDNIKIASDFPPTLPLVVLDVRIKFGSETKTAFELFINKKLSRLRK